MAGMWSRMTGRNLTPEKALLDNLKLITNSATLVVASDIPADALASVVESSHNVDLRQDIMRHLRECFAESSGKQWRRPYIGLLLLEALLKSGSPELVAETAEGRHFDLVQRLSFLEHSEFLDKRVQSMVRSKAGALRKEVIPLLENADAIDKELARGATLEVTSTGTPGSLPSNSCSVASIGFGSDDINNDPIKETPSDVAKVMILNNVVMIGHSDDTTSESECDDRDKNTPVRFREAKKMTTRERNEKMQQSQARSLDKEPAISTNAPQTVNLLDF